MNAQGFEHRFRTAARRDYAGVGAAHCTPGGNEIRYGEEHTDR